MSAEQILIDIIFNMMSTIDLCSSGCPAKDVTCTRADRSCGACEFRNHAEDYCDAQDQKCPGRTKCRDNLLRYVRQAAESQPSEVEALRVENANLRSENKSISRYLIASDDRCARLKVRLEALECLCGKLNKSKALVEQINEVQAAILKGVNFPATAEIEREIVELLASAAVADAAVEVAQEKLREAAS